MTGAPKLRTMEIIEEVEDGPRGPYAGAFGWVSGNGCADLGVVIRSLMTTGDGSYTLGTGGGITVQSDADRGVRRVALEGRAAAPGHRLGQLTPDSCAWAESSPSAQVTASTTRRRSNGFGSTASTVWIRSPFCTNPLT